MMTLDVNGEKEMMYKRGRNRDHTVQCTVYNVQCSSTNLYVRGTGVSFLDKKSFLPSNSTSMRRWSWMMIHGVRYSRQTHSQYPVWERKHNFLSLSLFFQCLPWDG